ncbi:hypothetical protein GGI12_000565 [Dipsacomyces acuminosporus]|nr:hypothetical protein GGI12_000565 [Dipsacomyces acuminosporus]
MADSDNRQRQGDEIVALRAIFGEDAVVHSDVLGDNSFELHAQLYSIAALADIRFHLPATYPSEDPPVFEWIAAHDINHRDSERLPGYAYPERRLVLSQDMREDIANELRRMWDEDLSRDVVIFSWISWLPEYLSTHWPQPVDPIRLPTDSSETKAAPVHKDGGGSEDSEHGRAVSADNGGAAVPKIYTGVPIELKKSVFVAHVARVKSGTDVEAVRSTLLQDKKIAQATHNILAYRIRLENGSISQDNDDDGEAAAGKRLAHLLQLVDVEDVLVVVTRWYGGIKLGADRFKLINNAARQALEDGGFLRSSDEGDVKAASARKNTSNSSRK